MYEWDYEPPGAKTFAKLGSLDDYRWLYTSRKKAEREWEAKQELRKELNEDLPN